MPRATLPDTPNAIVKDNLTGLKSKFLLPQAIQCWIVIPACVGLALIAKQAVILFFGEKWLFTVRFIQILAMIFLTINRVGYKGSCLLNC